MPLKTALAVLLTAIVSTASAQDSELDRDRAAVRAVIAQLFDGMRAGDSTAVRGVFADAARLVSTGSRDGVPAQRDHSDRRLRRGRRLAA